MPTPSALVPIPAPLADPSGSPVVYPPQFADTMRLAKQFLSHYYLNEGRLTLRSWQGHFWQWRERHYVKLEDAALDAKIWKELARIFATKDPPPKVTAPKVTDVRKALAALTLVEGDSVPMWLGTGPQRRLLAMKNGLIDLDVLLNGEELTVLPHSPEWFSHVVLPYAYDRGAEAPKWLNFLNQMLEKDQERLTLLHEWLGYLLAGSTALQKFLVLSGPPASGKSTVLNVTAALLGLQNVSHVPLDLAFDDRFALVSTLGKLANISPEGEHINPKAEGMLKAFTAGDRLTFRAIYKGAFEAFPTARLVFATNSIPSFADRSGATQRRMSVIPFNITVPEERRDPALGERFQAELAGIFNLAIGAYRAIEARKPMGFSRSAASEAALVAHIWDAQPELVFLQEGYEPKVTEEVSKSDLYGFYRDFCQANGHKILDAAQFAKQVKRTFPQVDTIRHRGEDGKQYRFWAGIQPKLEPPEQARQDTSTQR